MANTTNPFPYNNNYGDYTNQNSNILPNYQNPFGQQISNPVPATPVPNMQDFQQPNINNNLLGIPNNNINNNTNSNSLNVSLAMPKNFNGTQAQWDSLDAGSQKQMSLGLMGQKSGWEQAGSVASGIGSLAGGVAGVYSALMNAQYKNKELDIQKRAIASDNANKSAFAKASGGTYVPA